MRRTGGAYRSACCFWLAVAVVACPQLGAAQDAKDPQRGFKRDLSRGPIDLSDQEQNTLDLHVQLPELDDQSHPQALSSHLAHVWCASLNLSGNTVLPESEVDAITKSYSGREVTSEELEQARSALTKLYVGHGYVNSGVIIPDQPVDHGAIELRAIEGRLTRIRTAGSLPSTNMSRLLGRLHDLQTRPLNVLELRDELALIGRNPLVKGASGELLATGKVGEAELVLTFAPASRWRAIVTADNHRSPSVGSSELRADVLDRSLFGFGDQAAAYYALTEGLDDWGISYLAPVGASDWAIGARFSHEKADVIEEPFKRLNISSDDKVAELDVRRTMTSTLGRRIEMSGGLERISSTTYLFGIPFSFAPGVNNGASAVAEAQVGLDAQWWFPSSTFAAHFELGAGLNALGATKNTDAPDGNYQRLSTQEYYSRQLDERGDSLLWRLSGQLASTELLPLVKYEFGGASSVRGYRENAVVRDNGFATSIELRHPLFGLASALHRLELAAFVDYGHGWNNDSAGPPPQTLSSAGLGLVWNARENLYAELYAAKAFQKVGHVGNDLQDHGICLLISYRAL